MSVIEVIHKKNEIVNKTHETLEVPDRKTHTTILNIVLMFMLILLLVMLIIYYKIKEHK